MTEINSKKTNWKHKYRNLKRQEERQEFEDWTENDFISHILELREELESLQEKVEKQKIAPDKAEAIEEKEKLGLAKKDFKQEWPYSTKFVFLLTLEKMPLTSSKIHKQLTELDKQYTFYSNPKGTLSVYLRAVVKSGRIKAIKIPGFKEKLFALPEWVNKDGVLKLGYEHKSQFL